jgi:hypothetical protein
MYAVLPVNSSGPQQQQQRKDRLRIDEATAINTETRINVMAKSVDPMKVDEFPTFPHFHDQFTGSNNLA